MVESKEADAGRKLNLNKNRIKTYYSDVKVLLDKVLVARAAMSVKRNQKRRVSRADKKRKRVEVDNDLVEESKREENSDSAEDTTSDSESNFGISDESKSSNNN